MGNWILPTSASGWTDSQLAIDGQISTRAQRNIDASTWSPYLVAEYVTPLYPCTAVRFYVYTHFSTTQGEVQIYSGGAWQSIFAGTVHSGAPYHEVSLSSPASVEKIRVRFKSPGNELFQVAEISAYQEEPSMAKTFEVVYQAAGAATGKTVQIDVYKPDKSKDEAQSGAATEIGTTGRYYKSFDADAPGWSIQCSDNDGGKAVKHYGPDIYDAAGVTDVVADVQTAVDAVALAIATLDTAVGGVSTDLGAVAGDVTDIKKVTDGLSEALGAISDKVDALESPPMIG